MSSFKEFLKRSKLDDQNIDATAETVLFTNKNGKKFAYPIDDLEQCLLALWKSGDIVEELLAGDWKYEESKFRRAFGAAFAEQRSNSVASNLGSQTPNTVRCLELYAYFKLGKAPTVKLERPDVLSNRSLDSLFYGPDLSAEFQSWLSNKKDEKQLKEKSVSNYSGAISGLLSECAGKYLFRVSSPKILAFLRDEIAKHPIYIERNNTGNKMYSGALDHYSEFLNHRLEIEELSEISFPAILIEFSKSLQESGFKMME